MIIGIWRKKHRAKRSHSQCLSADRRQQAILEKADVSGIQYRPKAL